MRSLDEARAQFAYHPATEDTAPRHAAVRDLFQSMLGLLWGQVPDGPEKTLAIRALQESQMYANLAIALTAPVDDSSTRSVARRLPHADVPGLTPETCPEREHHGKPFRICPVKGCGWMEQP